MKFILTLTIVLFLTSLPACQKERNDDAPWALVPEKNYKYLEGTWRLTKLEYLGKDSLPATEAYFGGPCFISFYNIKHRQTLNKGTRWSFDVTLMFGRKLLAECKGVYGLRGCNGDDSYEKLNPYKQIGLVKIFYCKELPSLSRGDDVRLAEVQKVTQNRLTICDNDFDSSFNYFLEFQKI
jgi:hypothetical protein